MFLVVKQKKNVLEKIIGSMTTLKLTMGLETGNSAT